MEHYTDKSLAVLTPSDLASFGIFSPETLRDYRRLGYLQGIGRQQPNGHWKYSWTNALTLFLYQEIMKCGFDIASIRDWIFRVSELVTHHKLAQFDYVTTEPRYFRISTHPEFTEVLWGDDPEGVGKWVGNAFSNLDKVSPTVPACILIDCKDLASRTPTALDPSFEAYLKVLRSMESEGGKDA